MKPAHIKDLPQGFGRALAHFRTNQLVTVESLAQYSQIREQDIAQIERGEREPSLSEFLRLAMAMQIPPGHLFNRTIAEWPDDPEYAPPHYRAAAHHPRLFRLAWIAKRRTVHESPEAYETFDEALGASVTLNEVRSRDGLSPFIGVGVYIRTGSVWTVRDFLTESLREEGKK